MRTSVASLLLFSVSSFGCAAAPVTPGGDSAGELEFVGSSRDKADNVPGLRYRARFLDQEEYGRWDFSVIGWEEGVHEADVTVRLDLLLSWYDRDDSLALSPDDTMRMHLTYPQEAEVWLRVDESGELVFAQDVAALDEASQVLLSRARDELMNSLQDWSQVADDRPWVCGVQAAICPVAVLLGCFIYGGPWGCLGGAAVGCGITATDGFMGVRVFEQYMCLDPNEAVREWEDEALYSDYGLSP